MRSGFHRAAAVLAVLATAGLSGCGTTFDLERRETPVHVWLTVPAYARTGGVVEADITVGPYRVVQGPVTFPRGTPTVALPSLYIRAGGYTVSARLQGGQVRASQVVGIEGESWIQIVVSGRSASIEVLEEQPDSRGGS